MLILSCLIILVFIIEDTELLTNIIQGLITCGLLLEYNWNKIVYFSNTGNQGNQSTHTNGTGEIHPLSQDHVDHEEMEYPLNVPEAHDDTEIPTEQIPYSDNEDRALTDLRNDVRRAYVRIDEIEREQNYEQSQTADHVIHAHLQEFYRAQNELRQFLNQNHDGNFNVNPNI